MADVKPEDTPVEDHNVENNSVGEEDGHDEVRKEP